MPVRPAHFAVLAGSSSALMAWALRPHIALDDAAITFRYAERLASGAGFSYSDGQRLLGASNPLYTLILAGLAAAGASPPNAALVLGLVCCASCVAIAAWLGARLSGPIGGLTAGALLASDVFFADSSLGGLEVALAAALGLGVVAAHHAEREYLAGALLGLALVNKLDAAGLALGAGVAALLVRHRISVGLAGVATLVWIVWAGWAIWYFGSAIPHSLTTKLAGGEGLPFDPLWVARFLVEPARVLLLPLAALALWFTRRAEPRERLTLLTLALWGGLHVAAYSSISLGAPYGWYLTLPLVPLSILAGVGAAGGTAAPERPRTSRALRAACASGGLIALIVAFTSARDAWEARRFPKPDETFDADRQLAGLLLREHAAPGETLKTAYGWTAFESRLPVTDTTGLNTTPFSETATYAVYHGLPYHEGSNGPGAPPGMVPLASFNLASSRFPGFSWFVLFGRPDSAIARSRLLALRLRLSELRHHARDDRSAEGAIDGIALTALVPSITSFEYADGHIRGIFLTPWSPDDSSVTLSIEADAQELWHWRDSAPDKLRRVYVPVPRNSSANVVSFKAAGKGSAIARFLDVEVIVGDGAPDTRALGEYWHDGWQHHGLPPSASDRK